MKKIFTVIMLLTSAICYGQTDSTAIRQEVFPSLGKYALITNNGSSYDNVVHGSLEFINAQKPIEFNKALARRKVIAIITAKCKP